MIPAWTLAMMEGADAPAFTPLDLGSKLKAWWAPPEDGVNVTTSSGAIVDWTDEIGAYTAAQNINSAFRPAYNATSFNGVSCAEFDGTNDYLWINGVPAGIPGGTGASEFWAVVRQDEAGSSANIRSAVSQGPQSSGRRDMHRFVSGGVNVARAFANTFSGANTSVDLSGRHVIRAVFDTSSVRADVDGVAGSSQSTTLNTSSGFFVIGGSTINASSAAVLLWQGAIRQVLVTEPLSAPEAASLLSYLSEDV